MKNLRILAVLLLCFVFTPAHAQWSGSVKADGAWNFLKSNNEGADLDLKYTGKKFYVGTGFNIGHSFHPSDETTMILDAKKEKDQFYKGENKTIDPRKITAGAKLNFGYNFQPNKILDASLSYGFTGSEEKSLLQTERLNYGSTDMTEGTQKDTNYVMSHNIRFGASYKHGFASRPEGKLVVSLFNATNLRSDANRRVAYGSFYSKDKNYATYSSINDFNSGVSASYEDAFHFKRSDLKMKTGIDIVANQDVDLYFAETNVNGQWRDSTQYRQSYLYSALDFEPYVNLTYTVGKFDFFIKERVQIYKHAMMDKLENVKKPEDIRGLFNRTDPQNLLDVGVTCRINDFHRITIDYGRTIARPDYKKLCPTLMIDKSEGEYTIGNPDLLPEITDKVNLAYVYTKGIFVTRFDINYADKQNTAEKVIDLERFKDITDPTVKTLKTWINNKRQNSLGAKLDLKVDAKSVKADIWAGFNFDTYWKNRAVDKHDFNYQIGTVVDVYINSTTILSSSLVYISAKRSAYNLKGEDIIANLRFSKIIIKGLELYAELRDIVDKDIYEETWNADGNYLKVVSKRPMHRAALLGLKYVF